MNTPVSRRAMLTASGLTAAGLVLPRAAVGSPSPACPDRKRSIRLAHMTDVHVQQALKAGEGLAMCLHHIQSQKDKPDLIITGGDHVMDSFETPIEGTKAQ